MWSAQKGPKKGALALRELRMSVAVLRLFGVIVVDLRGDIGAGPQHSARAPSDMVLMSRRIKDLAAYLRQSGQLMASSGNKST